MRKLIIRLDDACEYRDVEKWNRMERLLDAYQIQPLIGIIPHCEDAAFLKYPCDLEFWNRVKTWVAKDWAIAMHGYNHVYSTKCGGINPVNRKSEFAGEPLEVQRDKIRNGVDIMRQHSIEPRYFFAPSHTFDENTLLAIKEESKIEVISDTIAWDSYRTEDFLFVPQQSGSVRNLPFSTITFCYHPNVMNDKSFDDLERFIKQHRDLFVPIQHIDSDRKKGIVDTVLWKFYQLFQYLREEL